jgi:redox-sensing transcriptional repressor
MTDRSRIPRPTVKRLSLYLRELEAKAEQDQPTISSRQLGQALDLTDAQVRKDLAYFGQFGHPGIGYRVADLIRELRKILGTDRRWAAAIVGAGNIGRALMPYSRFQRKGFDVVAIFDTDPAVVGSRVGGHAVRPMSDLRKLVVERDIKIGLLAVPANEAQAAAEELIDAGVVGILNFAPVRLDVGDRASVVSVDLSRSLEQLAFQVSLGMTGAAEDES